MSTTSLASYIQEVLEKTKATFEFIRLPNDLPSTVESAVKFHGISMKNAVPTIIFKTEKGLIAVQRRGDATLDLGRLKGFAGVKQLELASPSDLRSLGVEYGTVSLVGLPIPYFTDRRVLELDVVYGGSGQKGIDLKVAAKDLIKANEATIGDFSEIFDVLSEQQRVFSGIRATGRLHLGNYLGAVKGMLGLATNNTYETIYMVADLHTTTTPFDPKTLRARSLEIILDYLSCGLDPKRSVISIQSDLADLHTQLMFYFSTVTNVARMQDLPTFKDKVRQYPKNVTMALLNYPVLMAADILIYKASKVPVGIDQEPHLEVTREIARRMNDVYGTDFPEPTRFSTPGEYVPSLAGIGKMSKSVEGSFINLTDDLETIEKRLATAPTDSGRGQNIPQIGGVANLLKFVELFQGKERQVEYERQYLSTGIRYGDLKKELAEAIYKELEPIQEKRKELERNPVYVEQVLRDGAARARAIAEKTVKGVREKMGLL